MRPYFRTLRKKFVQLKIRCTAIKKKTKKNINTEYLKIISENFDEFFTSIPTKEPI